MKNHIKIPIQKITSKFQYKKCYQNYIAENHVDREIFRTQLPTLQKFSASAAALEMQTNVGDRAKTSFALADRR